MEQNKSTKINLSQEDISNNSPEVVEKVKELADMLNKKGEKLEIKVGERVETFLGLAGTCCN